jgi:hypothetical protein
VSFFAYTSEGYAAAVDYLRARGESVTWNAFDVLALANEIREQEIGAAF